MKSLIRSVVIYTLTLHLIHLLISGVVVVGGLKTLLIGGIVLTFLHTILKPVINVLSFPFNIGILSALTNALMLYLLTVFVPTIQIHPFTSPQITVVGVIIPSIAFNQLFAFLAVDVVLSSTVLFLQWLKE